MKDKKSVKPKVRNAVRAGAIMLCVFMCVLSVSADSLPCEVGSAEFYSVRELIARVAEATVPEGSYTARQAVCALIVNRWRDARFADDVRSVIYESGAFECVRRADFDKIEPSYISLVAARDALLGFDVTMGALYYRRGYPSERAGASFYHDGLLFYRDRDAMKGTG